MGNHKQGIWGSQGCLRLLEEIAKSYVLAVTCKEIIWTGYQMYKVGRILKALHKEKRNRLSIGADRNGEKLYDWLLISINIHPGKIGKGSCWSEEAYRTLNR